MSEPLKLSGQTYTYAQYRNWPDEERWELIEGTAYDMSPAPSSGHQAISFELSGLLRDYLKDKKCRAFAAPFDVFLPGEGEKDEEDISTIVQPDLSVICDSGKITEKGCMGAPDLVMEILSPYTSLRDLNLKFRLYEKSGVREYWVIDPGNQYIRIFSLSDQGKYGEGALYSLYDLNQADPDVPSKILDGFSVNLKEVFSL
ncbi:MAG: Uma2 family endonuclease [Spirochaetales bacterium]|nr:Uma2 family endonuclease [Spirochaetales bacterium]